MYNLKLMRKIALASTSVTMMVALVGCGTGGSQNTSTPQGKKTIQFWTISLKPTFTKYINGEIQQFEKAHPSVRVQWTDLPYSSVEPKLLAAIASGNPPDVVNLNTQLALDLAGKGVLVNLAQAATPAEKSIYFPTLWDSAKLDGGVYAFPWYLGPDVLMYNKSLFEKAGLSANNPPKTWNQVVADSKIIKAKTGVYGILPNINPINDFKEAGIPLLNSSKTKAAFNTPAGLKMMEWYKTLITDKIVPSDTATPNGYAQAVNDYQAGTIAMLVTGPQFLTRVKSAAPNIYKDTLVAPVPVWSTGIVSAPLMDLAIPKGSKDQKDAIDFASFMTNNESQLAFDKIASILPSTKKAANNPYFTNSGNTLEGRAKLIAVKELPNAEDINLGVKQQNQLYTVLMNDVEAVMTGQMTPQKALSDAAKQWDVILSGN